MKGISEMKKIGLVIIVIAFIAIFSSCSSHKTCPAYSSNQVEIEQPV